MNENPTYFDHYFESRNQFHIPEGCVNYEIADSYLPFLKKIDDLEISVVAVFDFYKKNIFYISERFFSLFDFDREKTYAEEHKYLRSRFHPDDAVINSMSAQGNLFLINQPVENRKNFRIVADFRIMNEKGNYIRLTQQDFYLELASNGMLWLNMKLFDFAADQDLDRPATYSMRNVKTNEIVLSFNASEKASFQISTREKEVLILIAKGLSSKAIGQKLFISENTVSNHRRNILEKLGAGSSTEAIRIASHLNII